MRLLSRLRTLARIRPMPEVDLPEVVAQVSVPYPDLASAFDRHGMTYDDDVNPDWLEGGVDGVDME